MSYNAFIKRNFVVKRKHRSSNAVSSDLVLKQIVQRSAKSSHGIIGKTKSADCVADCRVVLAITDAYIDITNSN